MPCRFASSGTVATSRSASRAILALNVASNFLRDLVISVLHPLRQSRTLHTLTFGPISGVHFSARSDRKQLARLMGVLARGDVLVVTRLDRLARSTRDLLNLLGTIAEKGAGFKSLRDTWADTTTAHGRLMLTVLGGLAEFERELIRTRTGEGRARAKARGVILGRKPKLTNHQKREAISRREAGEVLTDIARSYNVSHSTISRLS